MNNAIKFQRVEDSETKKKSSLFTDKHFVYRHFVLSSMLHTLKMVETDVFKRTVALQMVARCQVTRATCQIISKCANIE